MMAKIKYPRIGIGVMIQNKKGQVLLGLRQGSHGAGEWSFPGGHLEFGETIFDCAKREVKGETGLEINQFQLISVSEDLKYIKSDNKHYITIGILTEYKGGIPKLLEPNKCREWRWYDLNNLPDNLFEGTEMIIKNFKAGKIY